MEGRGVEAWCKICKMTMRLRKRVAYLSKLVFVEEPRTRCSIPAWEAYSISAFDISESSSRTSLHCIYGPRNITKEMIRILRWKPLPKYLFSLSQTCVLKGKKQLTSFRVQKTRYGRKTFLLLPSGSLDTSEVSSPRRALILGVNREGDGDRIGARSLAWMRITVALLVLFPSSLFYLQPLQ